MKMKHLLTTSALAVGFFLSTQAGQASHIPHGDLPKNPPLVTAGTSTLPDSLEGKKRPLSEVEGTENAIVLAKRPCLSAEERQNVKVAQVANQSQSVIKEFYEFLAEIYVSNGFFRENLFPFLSPKDLSNLALANTAFHALVCKSRMTTDPRRLHEKVWIGGPAQGTWGNYLFNAAMWQAMRGVLLMGLYKLGQQEPKSRDSYEELASRSISWLGEKFCAPENKYNLKYILGNLEKAYHFLSLKKARNDQDFITTIRGAGTTVRSAETHQPSRLLRNNAQDTRNKPERELITLINFVLLSKQYAYTPFYSSGETLLKNSKDGKKIFDPMQSSYFDAAPTPDQMGPLERLLKVEERIRSLQPSHQKTPEEVVRDWDFILKYAPHITLRSYQSAIKAYLAAEDYPKLANLIEKLPEASQVLLQGSSLNDCKKTAEKILEIKKYAIAAKIYEELIRMFPQAVTADDCRNAAIAYFRAKDYARAIQFCNMFVEQNPHLAAEIYEQAFRTHPHLRTLNNYRYAAKAHYYAEHYDIAIKIYEAILDGNPWCMTDEDYQFASMAYVREGNLLRAAEIVEIQRIQYASSTYAFGGANLTQ